MFGFHRSNVDLRNNNVASRLTPVRPFGWESSWKGFPQSSTTATLVTLFHAAPKRVVSPPVIDFSHCVNATPRKVRLHESFVREIRKGSSRRLSSVSYRLTKAAASLWFTFDEERKLQNDYVESRKKRKYSKRHRIYIVGRERAYKYGTRRGINKGFVPLYPSVSCDARLERHACRSRVEKSATCFGAWKGER